MLQFIKNKLFSVTLAIFALLSGALAVLAFAPFNQWYAVYISIFLLLCLINRQKTKGRLFATYLWGIGFFTVGLNWISVSINEFGDFSILATYLLVLLLACYLALYPLLFAYIITKFKIQSSLLTASIWLMIEILRNNLFISFSWLELGYSQTNSVVLGLAPLLGVHGITFFVVWCSSILHNLINSLPQYGFKSTHRNSTLGQMFSQSCMLLGLISLAITTNELDFTQPYPEQPTIKVALLQGNIQQGTKWQASSLQESFNVYENLIKHALFQYDLLILPETAIPTFEHIIYDDYLKPLDELALEYKKNIIIGTLYQDKQKHSYNSVVVLGNKPTNNIGTKYTLEQAERYNKHFLVPFGEYTPLGEIFYPLAKYLGIDLPGNMSKGPLLQKNLVLNNLAGQHRPIYILPAICYEIIQSAQLRANLTANTDYILTVSNDAWFGNSIGPWQHLQIAQMRAAEFAKPVIRTTNNGVTALINARGQIEASIPQFQQDILSLELTHTKSLTPYAMFGNIPLCCIILLGFMAYCLRILMLRLIHKLK